MVSTYILFNVTGSFLALKGYYFAADESTMRSYIDFSDLMDVCAFLSDACVYVFFQRRILNVLMSCVKKESSYTTTIHVVSTATTSTN